jgi:hypothetical protein
MNNDPPHPPVLAGAGQNYAADVGQLAVLSHQQLLKPGRETAVVFREADPLLLSSGRRVGLGAGDGRETAAMKTFAVAVAVLALIAVPAYAQLNAKRHQGDEKKTEQKNPQVDEKAYKAALERIPEPREKYDPWAVTKPADPAKKPK